MVHLNENERIDQLHRNDYVIIQDKTKFCFGIDAVLLSHFATAYEDEVVMDIGTGTGIIPILMEAKTKAKHFDAIDIQEESVLMATKSVQLNNLQNKIKIVHCDVKNILDKFKKNSYDVVTVNPPYMKSKGGILNDLTPKAIARHEIFCTFDDIVFNSSQLLKHKGRIYIIHRATRLVDIITTLRKYKLEPKKMQLIQSYLTSEPNLVLIEAIKDAKPMLNVMPNLIIYNQDGTYTKEVFDIYYN